MEENFPWFKEGSRVGKPNVIIKTTWSSHQGVGIVLPVVDTAKYVTDKVNARTIASDVLPGMAMF